MSHKFRGIAPARALLLILFLASVSASPGAESAGDGPVRFISYNVQFLPGPGKIANKRKNPRYRALEIGRQMAAYDVVGLNETFDDEPRERILAEIKRLWGEDYHAVVHPRPSDGRYNGGLLIASRLPIIGSASMHFTAFSSPKDYGVMADGFAAKGVLHARIARSAEDTENFIDVFVTHLEARADELRPLQYKEMAEFIAEHSSPGRPTVIMGDMNTRGNPEYRSDDSSQYRMMMDAFTGCRPGAELLDLWPHLKGDAVGGTNDQTSSEIGRRIDYIFVSNPGKGSAGGVIRLDPRDVRVNLFQDPEVEALSDHNAVEADLIWPR